MSQTPGVAPEGEPAPAGSRDPRPADADARTPASPHPSTPAREPGASVLNEPTDDERGVGWNEPAQHDDRDDEWYLRERPPHHG